MMRIGEKKLFLVVCFFVLLEPAYFLRIALLDRAFFLGKMIIFFILMAKWYGKRHTVLGTIKFRKESIPFVLMFGYMLINTVFHATTSLSVMDSICTIVALSVLISLYIPKNQVEVLWSLSLVTAVYMFLNFLTVLLFPKGLYSTYSLYENEYLCWLLGYKNPMSRFIILTLGVNLCNCFQSSQKLNWYQYLLAFIGILTVIQVDSATSLVAIVFMYVFVLLFGKIRLPRICNVFNVFLLCGLLTFLIYEFKIQELFSYLIVNLLHRNLSLTSRTYIWEKAMKLILERPIFGYGVLPAARSYELLKASHPHNFYLYQLYSGGIVGIGIVSVMIYKVSSRIASRMEYVIARICFFVLSAIIVMGITESLTQMPLLYPMFLLSYHIVSGDGKGWRRTNEN